MLEENQKKEKTTCVHTSKMVFIVFGVIVSAILLFYLNTLRIRTNYKRELASLRADGWPTNMKELADFYENGGELPKPGESPRRIPDSENAAIEFEKAFKLIVNPVPAPPNKDGTSCAVKNGYLDSEQIISCLGPYFRSYRKRFSLPLTLKVKATTRAYIRANSPAMKLIIAGLDKSRCVFYDLRTRQMRYDYAQGWRVVSLFLMRSRLSADEGKIDDAILELERAAEFMIKLKQSPFLFTYELRLKNINRLIHSVRILLCEKKLSDFQLSRLERFLTMLEPDGLAWGIRTSLPVFINNEYADRQVAYRFILAIPFNRYMSMKSLLPYVLPLLRATGVNSDFKTENLFVWRACWNASQCEFRAAMRIIETERKRASTTRGKLYQLSSTLVTIGTLPLEKRTRSRALLRSALTVLAIERYRLKHEELPASLNDLLPEYLESISLDPFSDKPLLYKQGILNVAKIVPMTRKEIASPSSRTASNVKSWNWPTKGYKLIEVKCPGYIVYSVGRNLKDDGGAGLSNKDITLTVTRNRK